ncbi:NADH pyrophosphatase [Vibrio orientalis CIP 102891 = ATCC 33934]|uniref:NAD-capped RNA hydrolase NudC n=1 Tax=Vibrio orientalis CIP 102891 = ATCC 33934 TaxID=675816 RepID=C9QNC8_VIBOR|nr:NAD(+) diphosphatase [Vibrio orientalis]EEX93455.1 NADH pyrophosphatase [Vibrio orientalis CIP 102891 = ATCC 33934]EGU49143.1 NADH pyrophosphatase [Vibrio orientalis CIP 102891 = ATCC 33934]
MLNKSDTNRTQNCYWCVVSGSDVWLVDNAIPFGNAQDFHLPTSSAIEIGRYNSAPVLWLNAAEIEHEIELVSLRECLDFPRELFLLFSKAVQYSHMTQSMRFCPLCGGRNHLNHNQLAMQCGDCRTLHYPRIFPCIIVAVRKQGQILLAQHPRHRNGMYTVIAGFVEVGETLEQCVAREVKEETGINVKNIQYFASQPWAFPSSLMMGFIAEYHSGELKPDYSELSDARWFDFNALPAIAPKGTIARELIEHTCGDV